MYSKKIIWIGFVLMVLLQLWAPAAMIFNKETVLKDGKAYKFRSAPVDPNDPFRGKYIVLRLEAAGFKPGSTQQWKAGETVYVQVAQDTAGFARIAGLHKRMPLPADDMIKATIDYVGYDSLKEVFIEWPFERFYMEESKAPEAEKAYTKAAADSNQKAYALVKVKNGDAVLQNVFINDHPISYYIKK